MNAIPARLRGFLDDMTLSAALTLALLTGLALPLGLAAAVHFSEQRAALLERQALDHARAIEVLALGMQTPLWELRPEAGRRLLDALMLDERITAIEVSSPLVEAFLSLRLPARRLGREHTLVREVFYEGQPIGRVQVTMDSGLLASRVTSQWVEMMISGVTQLLTALLIVLALMRYKVLQPLRRLVGQSQVLAAGALDRALNWRREDELGDLGRSFEETRLALRNLVADLDRRNRELAARERQLRAILDNMTDGITLVDRDLNLVAWNPRMAELLGIPPEVIRVGMPVQALVEFDLQRRALSPADYRELLEQIRESFRPGRASTLRDTLADGRRIEIRRRPIPDGGFVSSYTDVTAGEVLHQNEKLAALGALLAGVAHELNNPLSVVVGRSILLEEQLAGTPAQRSIGKVRDAAERCARIVRTFLAMARHQDPARVPVHLEQVIRSALDLVAYGLSADGVEVELDLTPDLPALSGDPDQLTQVVINLMINARHALTRIEPPRRLRVQARLEATGQIQVRVFDNGPGIPEGIRSRIFEPFFTTKPPGQGTGVGLSICHGILQAHGGSLAVETPHCGGTVFVLTLPVSQQPVADPLPGMLEATIT